MELPKPKALEMKLKHPAAWPWWFWILLMTAFVLFAPAVGKFVLNVVTRGKRLTVSELDANGDCTTSVDDLVAQANATLGLSTIDNETYSLARMLASEEESALQGTKVAIGWVCVNVAAARQESITTLLTTDINAHGQGKYGHQSGRWASTGSDPYEGDLTIAASINAGLTPDPTNGAVHFFRPTLQDELFSLGKVTATAADIDTNWGGNGYTVPGCDSGITFYGPT